MHMLSKCKDLLERALAHRKKDAKRLGSYALVGVIFLSVLALPNFTTPPGQSSDGKYFFFLDNQPTALPAVPGTELIPGSDVLPGFLTQPPVVDPPATESLTDEPIPDPESTGPEQNEAQTPPNTDPSSEESETPSEELAPDTSASPETSEPVTDPPQTEPETAAPVPDQPIPETEPEPETTPQTEPEPEPDPREMLTMQSFSYEDYYYSEEVIPLTKDQQTIALAIAAEYELPVELLYAMMCVETRFTTDIISKTNDYGIMQINIGNHDMLRERLGVTDFMDYEQNVRCGAYMLHLCKRYSETIPQLLMCYNRGPGGAKKAWEKGITFDYYCEKVTTEIIELLTIRNADQL